MKSLGDTVRGIATVSVYVCLIVCAHGEQTSQTDWPEESLIRPGQRVLLLGDSIIGPGMYGHVVNSLLDRLYPGSGVTFYCFGRAGTTVESIQPHLEQALKGTSYDWILLNFGHNDGGRFTPEEFGLKGRELLKEIRELSSAKLGWMSVLGAEPTPYAQEPGMGKRAARLRAGYAKHAALARATKELCLAEKLTYIPLHEAYAELLREREEQALKVTFTMDGSHPNVLGNWLVGAALIQCLGLASGPLTVEILQGEATSDHGRLPVKPLVKPLDIQFKSLFLRVRLVPPDAPLVECRKTPVPIIVDGRLNEWQGLPEQRISAPTHVTWELVPRCAYAYAASMRTCRDAKNLYFAFYVKEPDLSEGTTFPEIIEVFIDARKDTSRSGNVWRRTKGLTQFCFHRDFSGGEKGPTVRVMANGDKSQGDGARSVASKAEGGYTLEAAIPLANFRQIELGPETTLPWNWAVSFTDQAVNLDWLGLMSRTQSTRGYGKLLLGE